jgi:hypothetical protein
MNANRSAYRFAVASGILLLGGFLTLTAAQPGKLASDAPAVEKARAQAKLMHQMYAATLDVMHHHYFRSDRAVLPARALEDVFSQMENQTSIKAKWIAVNAKAMSVHHEPVGDFEKQAVKAIVAGKGEFERVEDGVYLRAGAIPLGAGCINCHTGFFAKGPNSPRFAGLVIRVPLPKE